MIQLRGVSKVVDSGGPKTVLLDQVNVDIPTDRRIAVSGKDLTEAISIVHLLSGQTLPNVGYIRRSVSVSYPLGYIGAFEPDLSVRENVMHVARLYGADPGATCRHAASLAHLGGDFDKPFGGLTRDQKTVVSQIVGCSLPFDTYCLHNDPRRKPQDFFTTWLKTIRNKGVILPVYSLRGAADMCDMAIVAKRGELLLFDRIEAALEPSER